MPLHHVCVDGSTGFRDHEHAKGALARYLLDGFIELYDSAVEPGRALAPGHSRRLIEDPGVWEPDSSWRIRIAAAGRAWWRAEGAANWYRVAFGPRNDDTPAGSR